MAGDRLVYVAMAVLASTSMWMRRAEACSLWPVCSRFELVSPRDGEVDVPLDALVLVDRERFECTGSGSESPGWPELHRVDGFELPLEQMRRAGEEAYRPTARLEPGTSYVITLPSDSSTRTFSFTTGEQRESVLPSFDHIASALHIKEVEGQRDTVCTSATPDRVFLEATLSATFSSTTAWPFLFEIGAGLDESSASSSFYPTHGIYPSRGELIRVSRTLGEYEFWDGGDTICVAFRILRHVANGQRCGDFPDSCLVESEVEIVCQPKPVFPTSGCSSMPHSDREDALGNLLLLLLVLGFTIRLMRASRCAA